MSNVCVICGRSYEPTGSYQKSCSVPCREEKNRRRHKSVVYREKKAVWQKQYVAKRKADPVRMEKYRKYQAAWERKKRLDPVYRKKQSAAWGRSMKHRLETDPVFRAKRTEHIRNYNRKKREKGGPEYYAAEARRMKVLHRKMNAQKAAAQLAAIAIALEAKQ